MPNPPTKRPGPHPVRGKRLAFVDQVIQGVPYRDAYYAAGYNCAPHLASGLSLRLSKHPQVATEIARRRVQLEQAQVDATLTSREAILAALRNIHDMTVQDPRYASTAVKALTLLGQELFGMFANRVEHETSDAEALRQLASDSGISPELLIEAASSLNAKVVS